MSDPLPISEVRAALDPLFSALATKGFLCGMYTLLLSQSLWKLLARRKKGFYTLSLILLWISVVVEFSSDWTATRGGYVVNNSSPVDIYIGLSNYASINRLGDVASSATIFIADAILIWRCHMLWHNSYILVVLLAFLVATAGLNMCNALFANNVANLDVLMNSLAEFSSFTTTVAASSLIALKIVLVTRKSHMRHSYAKVIEIVIESAVLVSIVFLGIAILEVGSYVHTYHMRTASGRALYQMFEYLSYCQGPITGIGPTLIAFRVAEEPPHNSTKRTGPVSRLTFRRTARRPGNKSQTADVQPSTNGFGTSHLEGGESICRLEAPVGIEVPHRALDGQEQGSSERLADIRNPEAVQ